MSVPGPTPARPDPHVQFNQSINLFEESFDKMQTAEFHEKKDQYIKVMNETLTVMQDTANAMLNKHLLEMKAMLAKDLNHYLDNPSEVNKQKVQADIDSLKNS